MSAGPRSSCHRVTLSQLCSFLSLTHAHLYCNHLLLLVKLFGACPLAHLSLSGSPCPIANGWEARILELPLSPANLWFITFRPTPHSYGGGLGGLLPVAQDSHKSTLSPCRSLPLYLTTPSSGVPGPTGSFPPAGGPGVSTHRSMAPIPPVYA